jgi:hypothetical protein
LSVGEGQPKQEGSSNGNVEDMEDGNGNISATTTPRPVPSLPPPPAAEVNAKDSPTPLKKTIAIQPKTIAAPVNGVFQDDEEEEDTLHQIKKKIKPFEITREVILLGYLIVSKFRHFLPIFRTGSNR